MQLFMIEPDQVMAIQARRDAHDTEVFELVTVMNIISAEERLVDVGLLPMSRSWN